MNSFREAFAVLTPNILSVGYEHNLLRLRSLLLSQSLKVDVLEAFDLATALEIARGKEPIAVVVLCHTVPASHQALILDAACKRHADTPVLSIFPGMCLSDTAGTPVSNSPEQLLAAVRQAMDLDRLASIAIPEQRHTPAC